MIVKDFLLSLNREELVRALMHQQNIYEQVVEDSDTPADQFSAKFNQIQAKLDKFIDELGSIEPKPNKDELMIMALQTTGEDLDSFALARKDLGSQEAYVCTYAYEFSNWEDILGWDISLACLYDLGAARYAASILYEMSFLGYDYKTQSEELNEYLEDWKSALDPTTLKSWDELKSELSWTDSRSEAEKVFDESAAIIAGTARKAYFEALCKLEKSYTV